MYIVQKLAAPLLLIVALFIPSTANTKVKKHDGGPLKRAELKEADRGQRARDDQRPVIRDRIEDSREN